MIDVDEMVCDLEQAADYENTEIGEMWRTLCDMWHIRDYGLTSTFMLDLENEIKTQHSNFTDNYKWIECTSSYCTHCGRGSDRTHKELVWCGD
jgi:hypothetical protein